MLVPLRDYSQQDLIEKKDELSLIFMINKLKNSKEFKQLKEIPRDYFEDLEKKTPEYLLAIIGKIVAVFLYRLNIPRKEVEHFTDQITRREFDMLFDSFEAYDVQETRRVSREEGKVEGKIEGKIEDIIELLEDISELPDSLRQQIESQTNLEVLNQWFKIAAKCQGVEEFQRKANL